MKLKITYNNEAKEGFSSGWGFSCLIEKQNQKILFDTGADSKELLYNINKLNINPKDINKVVISHRHWDHTGGLDGFMKENGNKATLIWPDKKDSFKISKGVYSTGALRGFLGLEEQSLVVESSKGLIVLVRCSHPGVDKILDAARHIKEKNHIYAIIGGFHGFNKLEALKGIEIIGGVCRMYEA